APERLKEIAAHLVSHWEARREQMIKLTGVPGKGMVVCYSRLVCALLYDEIIKLRPGWAHRDDRKGVLKAVYTGSPADREPISHHVRNETRNQSIRNRMCDSDDELELAIVASMWLR